MQFHVFVYGTLRPGGYYHRRLVAGRGVEARPAWVQGMLYALEPGYPGLRPGKRRVQGDVLSFDDETLMQQLDELEGYDPKQPLAGEYQRGQTMAEGMDGETLGEVFVYWIVPKKLLEYRGQLIEAWSIDSYTH